MDPQYALALLDRTVASIQLVVNHEGLSVGLTRKEHATLVEAVNTLNQLLQTQVGTPSGKLKQ